MQWIVEGCGGEATSDCSANRRALPAARKRPASEAVSWQLLASCAWGLVAGVDLLVGLVKDALDFVGIGAGWSQLEVLLVGLGASGRQNDLA